MLEQIDLHIFKSDALATGQHTPGFLKLFLCGRLYVCVCVLLSQGY